MPTCADMSSYLPRSHQDNQINFATNCVKTREPASSNTSLLVPTHAFHDKCRLRQNKIELFAFLLPYHSSRKDMWLLITRWRSRQVPEFKAALKKKITPENYS